MEKEHVLTMIRDVLEKELAVDLDDVAPNMRMIDIKVRNIFGWKLRIDDDDWGMIFVPEFEKRLGFEIPNEIWAKTHSVESLVADLIMYLSSRES